MNFKWEFSLLKSCSSHLLSWTKANNSLFHFIVNKEWRKKWRIGNVNWRKVSRVWDSKREDCSNEKEKEEKKSISFELMEIPLKHTKGR